MILITAVRPVMLNQNNNKNRLTVRRLKQPNVKIVTLVGFHRNRAQTSLVSEFLYWGGVGTI